MRQGVKNVERNVDSKNDVNMGEGVAEQAFLNPLFICGVYADG